MIKNIIKKEEIFLPMGGHILDTRSKEISQQLADFNVAKAFRKQDI